MHSIALTIKINPDKRTEYFEATKLHKENSKNERGCILFEVFESLDEPNTFLYMEAYKTREDFEFHSDRAYSAQYRAKLNGMLVKPVKSAISRYSSI
ncbi:MAG: antibiotic biosynthesis monooxygenase [Candidatus Heimdallarchaeota archaeon]|nr:antibiotic biosynthesis monooxygenase [Candidatus Heimdallarchaeota archaeon]